MRQTTIYEVDTGICTLCGEVGDVLHHISYFPEIKMRVCRKCHNHIKKEHPELCQYTNEDYHKFYDNEKLSIEEMTVEVMNYNFKQIKSKSKFINIFKKDWDEAEEERSFMELCQREVGYLVPVSDRDADEYFDNKIK